MSAEDETCIRSEIKAVGAVGGGIYEEGVGEGTEGKGNAMRL